MRRRAAPPPMRPIPAEEEAEARRLYAILLEQKKGSPEWHRAFDTHWDYVSAMHTRAGRCRHCGYQPPKKAGATFCRECEG